jgi:hypothetical protein
VNDDLSMKSSVFPTAQEMMSSVFPGTTKRDEELGRIHKKILGG